MNKEEVRNFLSKYISEFIFDEDVKSVEGLTRKISVDMELVIDDLESIYKFYIEKLGINSTLITLEDLCKTKSGEIWNDLSNLKDLKTLEELLALGIATGVILDDRNMRIEAFYKIGGDCVALNPHLLNIETPEEMTEGETVVEEETNSYKLTELAIIIITTIIIIACILNIIVTKLGTRSLIESLSTPKSLIYYSFFLIILSSNWVDFVNSKNS